MYFLSLLKAPLSAFKIIMEWACDAHQTGHNCMPQQKSYDSQLVNLAKWVNMEHMGRPLGYIANEDYYFFTAKRNINDPDVKNLRFHTQLQTILHCL